VFILQSIAVRKVLENIASLFPEMLGVCTKLYCKKELDDIFLKSVLYTSDMLTVFK